MGARNEVEQLFAVRRNGADVVLSMTAPAARDLASSLAQRGTDDAEWLTDVVQLLTAAATKSGESPGPTADALPPTFLRGSWSESEEDVLPQPSPAARQLETIGPHLVGVWRTKLRDGSLQLNTGQAIELADAVEAASTEASDVASAGRSALRAALAAREAAAKAAQAAATAAAAAIVLEREVGYVTERPSPEAPRSRQAAPTIGDAQAVLAAQVTAAAELLEQNRGDRYTDEIIESLRASPSSTEQA
jgi:hypothetical protein